MARVVYILDVKNEWYEPGSDVKNNRNSLAYRIFESEDVAKGYMEKVIASAMSGDSELEPTVTEKRDKKGMRSIEVEFRCGKDIIAGTETYTTISLSRRTAQDDVPEDPFEDIMNEIYVG